MNFYLFNIIMKKNDQANRPYYKLLELYFEDFKELLGDLPSLKKIELFGRLEQHLITLNRFLPILTD